MAKANGATIVPKPVPSAAALQMPQPVLPRSITQRLRAHPALPAPRSQGALLAPGESNNSLGDVTLTLADVMPQIPIGLLAQNAPVDLSRPLYFPMAQISAEMARGRPAVPLASVVLQCPELFRQPESINGAEMVRLPLQKLLEQIGRLKRIDYVNTPRALPPSPASLVETPKQLVAPVEPIAEVQVKPVQVESKPLPSWLQANNEPPSRNGHAPMAPLPPSPLPEKPAESSLKPFQAPPSDTAEIIAAEIIEIVPAEVEPVEPVRIPVDEALSIPEPEALEPLAGSRVEDYEVPTLGDAPVVEVAESEDKVLDALDEWRVEEPEREPVTPPAPPAPEPATRWDVLPVPKSAAVDPLIPPTISESESALAEPLHLPTPTIHTKVESGNFIVVGPFIPKTPVSHSAWIEHEAAFTPPPSLTAPPTLPSLLDPPNPYLPVLIEEPTKVSEVPAVTAEEVAKVSEPPIKPEPAVTIVGSFIPKTPASRSAWIEHEAAFVPPPSLPTPPPLPSLLNPPNPYLPVLIEEAPKVSEVLPVPAEEVAKVSELPPEPESVVEPHPVEAPTPAPVEPSPVPVAPTAPVAPAAFVRPPQPTRPAELVAPRPVSAPVIPRFPFRAPRAILKATRASESSEPSERPKPVPPRSPVFQAFAGQKEQVSPVSKKATMPRLFGANPLDRYFSTKASPPVNWHAAGALLGITGEVTPSRLAEAIVKLPGMAACLLVVPPGLTVSGEWPEPMGVDNSLAFGRRLARVLKQSNASVVSHRQIPVDDGALLVFSIDDLMVCVISRTVDIPAAIRQRLLVVAKAMAHARQALRKSEELEI